VDYQQLVKSMTPEIYQNLKSAVECGKWPDGKAVSREQREHCMQAMIIWGEINLSENERIGFVDKGRKGGDVCDEPDVAALAWKD
jgi:uncharacterized protein YeaC (DUF1315 family)